MHGRQAEWIADGWIEDKAILLSPLLNLAPARGSGPRLNHVAPILPLGSSRLGGTVRLSLAPDRETVEVTARLEGAAPVLQLRRLPRGELQGAAGPNEHDLLILLLSAPQRRGGDPAVASAPSCVTRRLSLANRHGCIRLPWSADLARLAIDPSELEASSIEGVQVEGASDRGSVRLRSLFDGIAEPMRLLGLAERISGRTTSSGAAACA